MPSPPVGARKNRMTTAGLDDAKRGCYQVAMYGNGATESIIDKEKLSYETLKKINNSYHLSFTGSASQCLRYLSSPQSHSSVFSNGSRF